MKHEYPIVSSLFYFSVFKSAYIFFIFFVYRNFSDYLFKILLVGDSIVGTSFFLLKFVVIFFTLSLNF